MSPAATKRVKAGQGSEKDGSVTKIGSSIPWRALAYGVVLAVVDCLAVTLAFLLAFSIRANLLPRLGHQLLAVVPADPYFQSPWLLLLVPVVFLYEGLYRRGMGVWDEIVRVLQSISFTALLAVAATFGIHSAEQYSRIVLITTWLLSLVLLPALRTYCRTRLLSTLPLRFLIVAGSDPRPETMSTIDTLQPCGYRHLGTVILDPVEPEAEIKRVVQSMVSNYRPDELLLDPQGLLEPDFRKLLRCLESSGVLVRVMSNLPVIMKLRASVHNVDGLLFLILTIWIKIDSRGAVFYSHRRLNSLGGTFGLFKFRTMHENADQRLREWMESGDARAEEFRIAFKLKDDPRITRVGKLLRKTSLDELPQLVNVLRGEISLVGPRPIVPDEAAKYGDDLQYLLMAKGGLTGLWQVSGRNDIDYQQRILLDSYYIRNWSVWSDVVILLKTVVVIWSRAGAY